MNRISSFSHALFLGLCLHGLLLAQETVGVFADATIPQIEFAAGDVHAALKAKGFTVETLPLASLSAGYVNKKVVIALATDAAVKALLAGQGGTAPGPLGEQAYSLQTTTQGQRSYWVLGGDSNGAMYGGLQVAENIQINGFSGTYSEQVSPHILKRGAKLNVPLDARLPTYSGNFSQSSALAVQSAWNMSFWKEWIDQQARNRYNLMTIWLNNPFPALVTVPGYEAATLPYIIGPAGTNFEDKTLTINQRIVFWKEVMQYARRRGFSFYFFNWTVCPDYASTVYPAITDAEDNATTKDYFNKALKQLLTTYPDLAGFGITPGDNMHETSEVNADWCYDAFFKGLTEFAQENPDRKINFIHRLIKTDYKNTKRNWLDKAHNVKAYPNIQFDFSLKHCNAFTYATTTPEWWLNDRNNIDADGNSTYLTLRNDGFFYHDFGDPQFIRDFVANLPPTTRTSGPHAGTPYLRGIYLGADAYTPMLSYLYRDSALNNKDDGSQTPMLDMNRRWYMDSIWGRVAYDPHVKDEMFVNVLKQRFPELPASRLFEAWAKASRPVCQLQELVMGDWKLDSHFYRETCMYRSKGANIFLKIQDFAGTSVAKGSQTKVATIVQTAANKVTGQQKGTYTLADEIEADSMAVIHLASAMNSAGNVRAGALIKNLQQQAYLNLYYAYKIRGATYWKAGNSASARDAMGKAYGWYVVYVHAMNDMYIPGKFRTYDLSAGWLTFVPHVLKEYTDLGGVGTPALPTLPASAESLITSPGVVSVVAGQTFTYQIAASNSPTSFSASDLPAGLSVDATTGIVTGKCEMPGACSFKVSASYATGFSVSKLVSITVAEAAGNTAPTIKGADMPDRTIAKSNALIKNAVYNGTFTIADAQTHASQLIVTAESSNPGLLPVQNIVLGGSGTNRTLKATPVADMVGSVTITVRVSDGTRSAKTSAKIEWRAP